MVKVRVGCGQLCSLASLPTNARIVNKLISQAIKRNLEVLFLPEASDYISKNAAHSHQLSQTTHELFLRPIQNHLKAQNQASGNEKKLKLAIGIHEPIANEDKVKNVQLYIGEDGEISQRYEKLHLFDISLPNGPILKESNSVKAGDKILDPFVIGPNYPNEFKIGLAICYDIRFEELSVELRKLGAKIITFPSAFTVKTGEAHWEVLGRARAIDSQSYVIMAAQSGQHDIGSEDFKRISYGESLIVDPWGRVLARGTKYNDSQPLDGEGDYYELIEAEIDDEVVDDIRMTLPIINHRRSDIFGE